MLTVPRCTKVLRTHPDEAALYIPVLCTCKPTSHTDEGWRDKGLLSRHWRPPPSPATLNADPEGAKRCAAGQELLAGLLLGGLAGSDWVLRALITLDIVAELQELLVFAHGTAAAQALPDRGGAAVVCPGFSRPMAQF